jgi:hypothetical protein
MTLPRFQLNFPIYEENFVSFFISVLSDKGRRGILAKSLALTESTEGYFDGLANPYLGSWYFQTFKEPKNLFLLDP